MRERSASRAAPTRENSDPPPTGTWLRRSRRLARAWPGSRSGRSAAQQAGDTWYHAGSAAGAAAAATLDGYSVKPSFVVLDAEGYNGAPGNSEEWSEFLTGWSNGIRSVDTSLSRLSHAVLNLSTVPPGGGQLVPDAGIRRRKPRDPATTGLLSQVPTSSGSYYAHCPAAPYEATVTGWAGGSALSSLVTVEIDCGP